MKKITSLVIAMVLVFSLSVTAFAADGDLRNVQYPETASSWARETIESAFKDGFISYAGLYQVYYDNYMKTQRGLSAGERVLEDHAMFANTPNFQANITRGQFAKMVVLWVMYQTKTLPADLTKRMGNDYILGNYTGGAPIIKSQQGNFGVGYDRDTTGFKDIQYGYNIEIKDNKVYQDGVYYPCTNIATDYPPLRLEDTLIEYAYQYGIVSGTRTEKSNDPDKEDSRWFSPNDTLTREQAATMILRAVKFVELVNSGADMSNQQTVWDTVKSASGTADQGFADINATSTWAVDSVNFCKANGIMNGTGGNNFSPKTNYTIEQAILTFSNIK